MTVSFNSFMQFYLISVKLVEHWLGYNAAAVTGIFCNLNIHGREVLIFHPAVNHIVRVKSVVLCVTDE